MAAALLSRFSKSSSLRTQAPLSKQALQLVHFLSLFQGVFVCFTLSTRCYETLLHRMEAIAGGVIKRHFEV